MEEKSFSFAGVITWKGSNSLNRFSDSTQEWPCPYCYKPRKMKFCRMKILERAI